MAKAKAKKAAKAKRINIGWRQVFTFVKTPKVEPPKDSVFGAVYFALRKLRSGSVQQLTDEALKNGLAKYTKQNYRIQTQIKLRRLVRLGAAKKGKAEKEEAPKAKAVPVKKAPAKKAVAKAPAKKVAPKKKAVVVKAAHVVAQPVEDGAATSETS